MTDTHTPVVDEQAPSEAELDAMFNEASESRAAPGAESAPESQPDEAADDSADPPAPADPPPAAVEAKPVVAKPAAPGVKSLDDMTPEELKAHAIKVEHERMAAVGRAAALQRERDRPRPVQAPTPASLPESERLETAFPDLAAAVKDDVQRQVQAVRQEAQQQLMAQNIATLEALHPGWHATMSSDSFSYWLSQQPAAVQAKYESSSVADYALLLSGFKSASSSPTTTSVAPTEAEKLAAQRAQRVQQQAGLPRGNGSNGGAITSEAGDPDALFDQLTAKRDLQLQRSVRPR